MTDTALPAAAPNASIRISGNGPYVVSGGPVLTSRAPLRDGAGEAVGWAPGEDRVLQDPARLCRCGRSGHKPFCDNSHRNGAFDGTCTADRAPGATRRKLYQGGGITMTDDESLCAGYEYCDRHGGVWRSIAAAADPAVRRELMQQVALCPSGRLQYVLEGDSAPEETVYPRTIAAIPDGPLWVLGAIPVVTGEGTYELRNRQLLCRCGASANKPFCDGSHRKVGFRAP